ncbi:hypothetical protein ONI83_003861 [Escherichia coli]|nr:hypothetical protein [Escherichia coli]
MSKKHFRSEPHQCVASTFAASQVGLRRLDSQHLMIATRWFPGVIA